VWFAKIMLQQIVLPFNTQKRVHSRKLWRVILRYYSNNDTTWKADWVVLSNRKEGSVGELGCSGRYRPGNSCGIQSLTLDQSPRHSALISAVVRLEPTCGHILLQAPSNAVSVTHVTMLNSFPSTGSFVILPIQGELVLSNESLLKFTTRKNERKNNGRNK
jgi:hypothetical protein